MKYSIYPIFYMLAVFFLFSESSLGDNLSEGVSVPKGENLQHTSSSAPFFYSAEKDGNRLFILGTIHTGFSLNDLICSAEITERIKTGDLVFVENRLVAIDLDLNTLRAVSKEKRQEILSKLSPEDRNILEEMDNKRASLMKSFVSAVFVSDSDGGFEDLSQKTRDLLINLGADEEGDYLDYYSLLVNNAQPYFSDKFMDREVARRAVSEGVELQFLDDLTPTQIIYPITKNLEQTVESFGRIIQTKLPIDSSFLENFVEKGYSNLQEIFTFTHHPLLPYMVEAYRYGDEERIQANLDSLNTTEKNHILKERNQLWRNKIKAALEGQKSRRIFLAAGVSHLIDDHNLLDMLQEEGFHIHRMDKNCSLTFHPTDR